MGWNDADFSEADASPPPDEAEFELAVLSSEGFRDLVEPWRTSLQARAAAIVRDEAVAEDVVQAALLALWQRRGHPELRGASVERLRRYCAGIVVNLGLSERRRRHRQRSVYEQSLTAGQQTPGARGAEANDPAEFAAAAEAWEMVLELPDGEREVMVLRFGLGLTVEEVAAEMGIPPGTVKTRQRNALRNLRARYGVVDEDEQASAVAPITVLLLERLVHLGAPPTDFAALVPTTGATAATATQSTGTTPWILMSTTSKASPLFAALPALLLLLLMIGGAFMLLPRACSAPASDTSPAAEAGSREATHGATPSDTTPEETNKDASADPTPVGEEVDDGPTEESNQAATPAPLPENWVVVDDSALGDEEFVGVAITEEVNEIIVGRQSSEPDRSLFESVSVETRNGRKGFELPLVPLCIVWVQTRGGTADVVGMVNQRGRIHGEEVRFRDQLMPFLRWQPHTPLSRAVEMENEVPVIKLVPPGILRVSFVDSEGAPTEPVGIHLRYQGGGGAVVEPERLPTSVLETDWNRWDVPVAPGVEFSVSVRSSLRIEPSASHRVESNGVEEILVRDLRRVQMLLVVEDSHGERLVDAEAMAVAPPDAGTEGRRQWTSTRAVADSEGRIRFAWNRPDDSDEQDDARNQRPEVPDVQVSAPGYEAVVVPFQSIEHGEELVRLTRLSRSINIRLQDSQGELIKAPVTVLVNSAEYKVTEGEKSVQVSSEAAVLFINVQSDEYEHEPDPAVIRDMSQQEVVFTLAPLAVLELTVEGVDVAGGAGGHFRVNSRDITAKGERFTKETEWPRRVRVPDGTYTVSVIGPTGQIHHERVRIEGKTEYRVELGEPVELFEYDVVVPSEIPLTNRSYLVSGDAWMQDLSRVSRLDDIHDDSPEAAARRLNWMGGRLVHGIDPRTATVQLPELGDTWHLAIEGVGKLPARVNHAARLVMIDESSYVKVTGTIVKDVDGERTPMSGTISVRSIASMDQGRGGGSSDFLVHPDDETNRFVVFLPPGKYDIALDSETRWEHRHLELTGAERLNVTAGDEVQLMFEATSPE